MLIEIAGYVSMDVSGLIQGALDFPLHLLEFATIISFQALDLCCD